MKKLTELDDDCLLVVDKAEYDPKLMSKKEFVESHYYLDREDVDVSIADERYASFDLQYALECVGEDEMHEDWLENVMDRIPKEVRERIEAEINEYLNKEPTYYPGKLISW